MATNDTLLNGVSWNLSQGIYGD